MKKLLAVLLCFSLATVPVVRAQQKPVVQKCFVEIIGVILLIGIYCCTRWGGDVEPPTPKPPKKPPGTNAPPSVVITNQPPALPALEINSVCRTNVSAMHWPDPSGPALTEFTNQMSFWIQTSVDLLTWSDWLEVYGWQSAAGDTVSLSDGTNTVCAFNPERLQWPSPPPGCFFRTVAK